MEDIVKLCNSLNIKPWKLLNNVDVKEKKGLTKKRFINWWFSKEAGCEETKKTKKCECSENSKEKLLKKLEELNREMTEVLLQVIV